MSTAERMTLAAGLAVALACASFGPMFAGGGWAPEVLGAVLAVVIAGLISRRLSVPKGLQPVLSLALLAGYLLVVFAGSGLDAGVLPTGRTTHLLSELLSAGNNDIQRYRAPVPTSQGLLLMTAAGTGVVAVVVDFLAACLQRAGLAGLPLLVLFAVPAAVVPGGIGWLPFALGATGWLLMLAVEGHDTVRRWSTAQTEAALRAESSLGRLGRRIGVSALGIAAVVPLLVPGLDKTLIGGSGRGEGPAASSSAQTYNPLTRLRAQLSLPTPVELFQYRTDDPSPDYVRLTTLDRYDGTGWSASPLSQRRDDAQVQRGIAQGVGEAGPHRSLSMQVALDPGRLDVFWLPLPYGPTKVDVSGTWLWDPASQTAFSASRTTKGLPPYHVSASRALPDRQALTGASLGAVDPAVRARYARPITVSAYVRSLTANVTAGATTEYAKATAIQAFFTDQASRFFYDLTPSVGRAGQDQLEAFLRGRHGFCEQYATAMAAMLRVAGVPSRVAVGFTHGSAVPHSPPGPPIYSVTTHDAHAWPEAWFAGTGWVRFEPTPAESGATVPEYTQGEVVTPTPQKTPGAKNGQPSAKPNRDRSRLEKDLLDPAGSKSASQSSGLGRWAPWVVALLVLVVALALPAGVTALRRRRHWRQPGPLTAWRQLQEDAEDLGHRWHSGDSPRAGAARLAASRRLPDPARTALDRVALAAEVARFGRGAAPKVELPVLKDDVQTVRSALRHGAARPMRLRAQLCPPSTVRWAVGGAGDLLEATTDRLEDGVAKAVKQVRGSR